MNMEDNNVLDFRSQLEKFNTIAFSPKGNSMYPFIKNKSQTVFITRKEGRLSPFDIALYTRQNGTYVLHRVLELKEDGYVFCGDSQFYFEEIKEDKVIGVLTAYQKGKNTISFKDEDRQKARRWYKKKGWRKVRLAIYFFFVKIKAKIRKIFSKKEK